MLIGKSWIILSPGERDFLSDRIPIFIQKGAFGSGEHETTASCLKELEDLNLERKRVLDLGCGTGILAIAASKKGAKNVVAVDIDQDAIETTLLNLDLNKVNNVELKLGSIEKAKGIFDLIIANLYGYLLIEMAEKISSKLAPEGELLLSGILYEERFYLLEKFSKFKLKKVKEKFLDEYVTLLLRKHRAK